MYYDWSVHRKALTSSASFLELNFSAQKMLLLCLKICQTVHLSTSTTVCRLCVCSPFHVKTKKAGGKKCLDFKEADECLETIKLSILPCVKTLLRLGNLRDITSTAFISFTGDFLETYLPHSFSRFLLRLF